MNRSFAVGVLSLCAVLPQVQAQTGAYAVVVPGYGATTSRFQAYPYAATPFTPTVDRSGPQGAYRIFPRPDGSKFFFMGNTAASIQASDGSFSNFSAVNGIPNAPTAAAMTPDGKLFIVGAGDVYLVDAGSNSVLGGGLGLNGTIADIAVSRDSTVAWVLFNTTGTSSVVPISLTSRILLTASTLQLPYTGATNLSLSPTGLLYVSASNAIYEIDPSVMKVTTGGNIALNFTPGPLRFVSDGSAAYAVNQGVNGGSLLRLLPASRAVVTWPSAPPYPSLTDVYVAGASQIYALSPGTGTLYDVTTSPLSAATSTLTNILGNQTITGVALSNELPNARYLYAMTNTGTLSRVNIAGSAVSGQSQSAGGAIVYANVPPQTGGASFLQFNTTQVLATGGAGLPLIVRLLDGTGRPVYNQTVTFSTDPSNGATIAAPTTTTTSDGWAQTGITIPNTPGTYNIQATSGNATATFVLTVPGTSSSGSGGGGTTVTPAGPTISIVSGDGMLLREETPAPYYNPLTVQVLDATGKPIVGADVNFTITGQQVGLLSPVGGFLGGVSIDSLTDNNGKAYANFTALAIPLGYASITTTVAATTAAGAVNFNVTVFHPNSDGTGQPQVYLNQPSGDAGYTITVPQGGVMKAAFQAQIYNTNFPQTGQGIPYVGAGFFGSSVPPDPSTPSIVSCVGDPLSDSTGLVSCDVTVACASAPVPRTVGVYGVIGQYRYFPITVNITPGGGQVLKSNTGDKQSGKPGTLLPAALTALLTDNCGNPLPGIPVTWTVTSGVATLSNVVGTTDSNGGTAARVTLGQTAGTVTVKVTAGSSSATFTLTVQATVGGLTLVSGDAQSAFLNAAFGQPIVFKLSDTQGNGLTGLTVNLSASNGATLSAATAVTDANGRVSVTATAGASAGKITVTATYQTFTATANLTATPPGPQITANNFLNGASFKPGLVPCSIAAVTGPGVALGVTGTLNGNLGFGPLPYSLGGVSVLVNGIAAPLFAVTNANNVQQINFQMPCETQLGTASITVNAGGGSTTVSNVPVLAVQPGIFTYAGPGNLLYGVVQSAADGSYITPSNYAKRGGTYFMYATGLGAVSPATITNAAGIQNQIVANSVSVGVNNYGITATAQYAPSLIGVYLVTFTLPQAVPPGANVPLALLEQAGGVNYFDNQGTTLPGVQ